MHLVKSLPCYGTDVNESIRCILTADDERGPFTEIIRIIRNRVSSFLLGFSSEEIENNVKKTSREEANTHAHRHTFVNIFIIILKNTK